MILRFTHFWIFLSCLPLLSCVGDANHVSRSPVNIVPEIDSASQIVMAEPRTVNVALMDNNLALMIAETQAIEAQLSALTMKLNALRDQINGEKIEGTADPVVYNAPHSTSIMTPMAKIPVKPMKVKEKPRTVSSVNDKGVQAVRLGLHPDKTRLVFDINGSTKHRVEFDKELGVLTITLPKTKWVTQTGKTYNISQLAGYEAKNSGQGSIVAFSVKKTSTVKSSTIAKTNGKPARLVVDLIR